MSTATFAAVEFTDGSELMVVPLSVIVLSIVVLPIVDSPEPIGMSERLSARRWNFCLLLEASREPRLFAWSRYQFRNGLILFEVPTCSDVPPRLDDPRGLAGRGSRSV